MKQVDKKIQVSKARILRYEQEIKELKEKIESERNRIDELEREDMVAKIREAMSYEEFMEFWNVYALDNAPAEQTAQSKDDERKDNSET